MNNEEKILQILTQMQNDISGLKEGQATIQADITEFKQDTNKRFDNLEQGQTSMQADTSGLKSDVSDLKTDVNGLKADVSDLKQGQAETNGRLDKLENNQDLLANQMMKLTGSVATLQKSVVHIEHQQIPRITLALDAIMGHTEQIGDIKKQLEDLSKVQTVHDLKIKEFARG